MKSRIMESQRESFFQQNSSNLQDEKAIQLCNVFDININSQIDQEFLSVHHRTCGDPFEKGLSTPINDGKFITSPLMASELEFLSQEPMETNTLPQTPNKSINETQPQSERKIFTQDESLQGYPSKNFLQAGKKPHFEYIKKSKGYDFIKKNQTLKKIQKKSGISMKDYQILYKMNGLREIWPRFFKEKVLYRELMLTRLQKEQRLRFQCLLFRYQEAFKSGKFDYVMPDELKQWRLFKKVKRIRKQKKQHSFSCKCSCSTLQIESWINQIRFRSQTGF